MPTATTIASGVRGAPLRLLGDERLASLAADGDKDAFGLIYERFQRALLSYCRSIVHDDDDARDALQNTFVNALPGLAHRRPGVPLKAWLYRIAHNESISLLRRRRPSEELSDGLTLARAPELDAADRERLRELVADLNALPDRQRGALVMRELSGLGYDEIGSALGVTGSTARQIVFEARSSLTEYAGGRETACSAIQRSISDGDRRVLRGRRVRAHLRGCQGCRAFEHALGRRRRDFALLLPALPGLLAGLLKPLAGKASGGLVAGLTGGAAASPALKGLAVSAVVVVAGAGSVDLAEHAARGSRPEPARAAAAAPAPRYPASARAATALRRDPKTSHVVASVQARSARPALMRPPTRTSSAPLAPKPPRPDSAPEKTAPTQPDSAPAPVTAPARQPTASPSTPVLTQYQQYASTWESTMSAAMAAAQTLTQQAAQLSTSYTQLASQWMSVTSRWFPRSSP